MCVCVRVIVLVVIIEWSAMHVIYDSVYLVVGHLFGHYDIDMVTIETTESRVRMNKSNCFSLPLLCFCVLTFISIYLSYICKLTYAICLQCCLVAITISHIINICCLLEIRQSCYKQ